MSDLLFDFPATDPKELAMQAKAHARYIRDREGCDDPDADELDALADVVLRSQASE